MACIPTAFRTSAVERPNRAVTQALASDRRGSRGEVKRERSDSDAHHSSSMKKWDRGMSQVSYVPPARVRAPLGAPKLREIYFPL